MLLYVMQSVSLKSFHLLLRQNKSSFYYTNSYPLHLWEYLDFLKSYLAKDQSHL